MPAKKGGDKQAAQGKGKRRKVGDKQPVAEQPVVKQPAVQTDAEQVVSLQHTVEHLIKQIQYRSERDHHHRQQNLGSSATPEQLLEANANLLAQMDEMNAAYRRSSAIHCKAVEDNAKYIDDLLTRLASAREFCSHCQIRDQTFRLCPSCIDTLERVINKQRKLEVALAAERAEHERLDKLEKAQDEAHVAAELALEKKKSDALINEAKKTVIARQLVDLADGEVQQLSTQSDARGSIMQEVKRQAIQHAPVIVSAVAAGTMAWLSSFSRR